jgi:hypothetical protein
MMNELIRELEKQCWDNQTNHLDTEKFAELLVREHLGIWDLMDNGNKVEGYIDMEDYPNAIIKHFGVEE